MDYISRNLNRCSSLVLGATLAMSVPGYAMDQASPPSRATSVRDHVLAAKADKQETVEIGGTRIFGGRMAEEGAWPMQVGLLDTENIGDTEVSRILSHFCGGSLISQSWVLTAAHCVTDENGTPAGPGSITIQTGSRLLQDGDLRKVQEITVHEDYDPTQLDNDIALIKLAEPIEQSSGPIGYAQLIAADEDPTHHDAVVIGWGLMENGKVPDVLYETDIAVEPNSVCNNAILEQNKSDLASMLLGIGTTTQIPMAKLEEAFSILTTSMSAPLSENMMCAGVPAGDKTSCSGDSGGPLLVQLSDNSWLQVGIVSWGYEPVNAKEPCGHPQLYSVYTRLSRFAGWIDKKIGNGG